MATTTTVIGAPDFVADHNTKDIDQGHVIDWANVDDAFINATTGKKEIPAGQIMMRTTGGTYANSHTGDAMIPSLLAADTEILGLLAAAATEDRTSDSLSGHGVITSGTVFENLIPNAAGGPPAVLAAGYKTSLNDITVGRGFTFRLYYDSRAA